MSRWIIGEEITCDGATGCVRRIHGDVQAVDRITRSSGWQLGTVDLCPNCKQQPEDDAGVVAHA